MNILKIQKNKILCPENSGGFALLFSILLSSILLSIALGIGNVAFNEIKFGTSAKDTNEAFFAADAGVECAMGNDKSSSNVFVASSPDPLTCLGSAVTVSGVFPLQNFILFGLGSQGQACAKVTVDKTTSVTQITSRGYNVGDPGTCDSTNPNRIERRLEVASSPGSPATIFTDGFNNYIDGAVTGQGNWLNSSNFIVQGANVSEGTKALHVTAVADSVITKMGASIQTGIASMYVKTESRSTWGSYAGGNFQIRVASSPWGGIYAGVNFHSDGTVSYTDNGVDANLANNFVDNVWNLVEIQWRASDKTARYRLNGSSGTWTNWVSFTGANSFSSFNNIGFDFYLPSGSGGVYIDNIY